MEQKAKNEFIYVPKMNEGDNLRNLRSRGYPSSTEGYVHKYKVKEILPATKPLIMDDTIQPKFYSKGQTQKRVDSLGRAWLKGAVGLYDLLKPKESNLPAINVIEKDEFDNQDRPVRAIDGIEFESPSNERSGYLQKDRLLKSTKYSGSINGMNSILGNDKFSKVLDTQLGRVVGTYDGDTLYGSLTKPDNLYYLNALRLLLDRGTL